MDGVQQPAGNTAVEVVPGKHTISVPDTDTCNISIEVQRNATFEAEYVTQHRLVLESRQATATGSGWHDEGSIATFSVPEIVIVQDFLGIMGAKWRFRGWYEDERLLSASNKESVTMDRQHVIAAHWEADYSMPLTIAAAIIIAVLAATMGYALRRRPKD